MARAPECEKITGALDSEIAYKATRVHMRAGKVSQSVLCVKRESAP